MISIFSPQINTASAGDNGQVVGDRKFDGKGNEYEFQQFDPASADSIVPGCPAAFATASTGILVTSDRSRANSTLVMGAFCSSMSSTKPFGWILVAGDPAKAGTGFTLKTDGNVTDGQPLVFTTDLVWSGRVDSPDSFEGNNAYGIALAADVGSLLTNCRVGPHIAAA